MRSPVQARGGHTALPNELLALALGELTAEQFRLLVGLFFEAEFKRDGGTAGPWRVAFGQVLVSYEGLSGRYGLSVDAIRRALRRFEVLGITSRRAEAATPPATPAATSHATKAATPPTIVDLGKWGGFLGSEREAATPPATPAATSHATQPAPIQHRNTRTPNTEKRAPTAEPPAEPVLELVAEAPPVPPEASPHQRAVRAWFERWERAGRGKHPTLTGAEAVNIKRLVEELGIEELIMRFDRAFQDPWFLEKGDLLTFARQKGKFAAPGRAPQRQPVLAVPPPPPVVDLSCLDGLPGARQEVAARVAGLTEQAAARMLPSIVEAVCMERQASRTQTVGAQGSQRSASASASDATTRTETGVPCG